MLPWQIKFWQENNYLWTWFKASSKMLVSHNKGIKEPDCTLEAYNTI